MNAARVLCLLALCLGTLPSPPVFSQAASGGTSLPTAPRNSITVKPGETKSNGDVTVQNTSSGNQKAIIKPKEADGPTDSNVETKTGFDGNISGLEDGDSVDVGSSNGSSRNPVTISGTGGTIKISGGSSVAVTNTSSPGGGNISVVMGGATTQVQPGDTLTFNS